MKKWQLRQQLRDLAMRRVLLELLQEATKEYNGSGPGIPNCPEPMRDDDDVKEELRRILGIKKGWFR